MGQQSGLSVADSITSSKQFEGDTDLRVSLGPVRGVQEKTDDSYDDDDNDDDDNDNNDNDDADCENDGDDADDNGDVVDENSNDENDGGLFHNYVTLWDRWFYTFFVTLCGGKLGGG